jgi:hypothetical protein
VLFLLTQRCRRPFGLPAAQTLQVLVQALAAALCLSVQKIYLQMVAQIVVLVQVFAAALMCYLIHLAVQEGLFSLALMVHLALE